MSYSVNARVKVRNNPSFVFAVDTDGILSTLTLISSFVYNSSCVAVGTR